MMKEECGECCTHNCVQGRNCPARGAARVAGVGRRLPGPEPLPVSNWRQLLRSAVLWVLMVMLAANLAVLVMVLS